ncbi:hypothetical protein GGH93_006285 [Coemansia aciculifera]|nr:hypothetical protein GGH93_006285 [Coemansia aciculifera]
MLFKPDVVAWIEMYNSKLGVTHAASSAHISDNDMKTNDSVEGPAPCVGTEVGIKIYEQRAPANDTGDNEVSSPLPTLPELSTLLSSPQHKELSPPPQHEELLLPPQHEELLLPLSPLSQPEESSPLPALLKSSPLPAQLEESSLSPAQPESPPLPVLSEEVPASDPAGQRKEKPAADGNKGAKTDKPCTKKSGGKSSSKRRTSNSDNKAISMPPASDKQHAEPVSDAAAVVPPVVEASSAADANDVSTSALPTNIEQQGELTSDAPATIPSVAEVNKDCGDNASTSENPARDKQQVKPVSDFSTGVLPVAKVNSIGTDNVSTSVDPANSGQPAEPNFVAFTTVLPVIKTSDVGTNDVSAIAPHASREQDAESHAKSRAKDKAKASALNISAEKDSAVNNGGSDSSDRKVAAKVSVTRSVRLVSSISAPTPSPIAIEASHDVGGLAANNAATQSAAPNMGGMAAAEAEKKTNANKDSVSGRSNGAVATPTSFAPPKGPVPTTSASTPVPVDAKASHSVGSSVATGTSAQLGTPRANRSDKGKEPEGRNPSDVTSDDLPTSVEPATAAGGSLRNLGEGSSRENESIRRSTVDSALDSIITEKGDIAEGSARNSDGNSFGASIVIQPLRPVLKSDTAGQGVVLVTDTNDNVQPTVPLNSSLSADGDADMQDTDSPKGTDAQTVDTDAEMREARLLNTDTDMREARPLDTDTEMREVVPLADDDVMQDAELPRGTGALHEVEPPPADVEMEVARPLAVDLEMEDAELLTTDVSMDAVERLAIDCSRCTQGVATSPGIPLNMAPFDSGFMANTMFPNSGAAVNTMPDFSSSFVSGASLFDPGNTLGMLPSFGWDNPVGTVPSFDSGNSFSVLPGFGSGAALNTVPNFNASIAAGAPLLNTGNTLGMLPNFGSGAAVNMMPGLDAGIASGEALLNPGNTLGTQSGFGWDNPVGTAPGVNSGNTQLSGASAQPYSIGPANTEPLPDISHINMGDLMKQCGNAGAANNTVPSDSSGDGALPLNPMCPGLDVTPPSNFVHAGIDASTQDMTNKSLDRFFEEQNRLNSMPVPIMIDAFTGAAAAAVPGVNQPLEYPNGGLPLVPGGLYYTWLNTGISGNMALTPSYGGLTAKEAEDSVNGLPHAEREQFSNQANEAGMATNIVPPAVPTAPTAGVDTEKPDGESGTAPKDDTTASDVPQSKYTDRGKCKRARVKA